MCGRYTLTLEEKQAGARMAFGFRLSGGPRYNIAPSQLAPVVVRDGESVVKEMRWGLIPFWAKDEKFGYKTINAMAETVAEKPAYRAAFKKRRCLVVADGFYEWLAAVPVKRPHRFTLRDGQPFAFAGLWERWKKPDGADLDSFTIITTEANELTRQIHNRMPVILKAEDYERWLDAEFKNVEGLKSLLKPYPADGMRCYEVSPYVSNAQNEGPQCVERV